MELKAKLAKGAGGLRSFGVSFGVGLLFSSVLILLQSVGGFTDRQSLSLIILFLAFGWLLVYWTRKTTVFTPFSVLIAPNWYVLLKDNGLIDDEKWEAINLEAREDPKTYNALRDGISFTVLQPELMYSNNHHLFLSRVDLVQPGIVERISEKLTVSGSGVQIDGGPHDGEEILVHKAHFYVRLRDAGLEIGVTVPEFKPAATLPLEVFWSWGGESVRRWQRNRDRCKLLLSELGWTEDYKHKYAQVWPRTIAQ